MSRSIMALNIQQMNMEKFLSCNENESDDNAN